MSMPRLFEASELFFHDYEPAPVKMDAALFPSGEDERGNSYEVIVPRLTLQTVRDELGDDIADALIRLRGKNVDVEEALEEGWQQPEDNASPEQDDLYEAYNDAIDEISEFRDRHADGYAPLMNYFYPVTIQGDAQDAANRMAVHACNTCLVSITDNDGETQYYIGLTGGGMDFSHEIAAAYVCCGSMPKLDYLLSPPHFAGGNDLQPEMNRILLACMDRARERLLVQADRLIQSKERFTDYLQETQPVALAKSSPAPRPR